MPLLQLRIRTLMLWVAGAAVFFALPQAKWAVVGIGVFLAVALLPLAVAIYLARPHGQIPPEKWWWPIASLVAIYSAAFYVMVMLSK